MRTVATLPSGFVDLQCLTCDERYSYWNGSVSFRGDPNPPACPACGSPDYRRVFGAPALIDNSPFLMTRGQINRAEALAMAHRYVGVDADQTTILKEYGKYIAKENEP